MALLWNFESILQICVPNSLSPRTSNHKKRGLNLFRQEINGNKFLVMYMVYYVSMDVEEVCE